MVLSDVLQTSKQHLLFSNSISTGLKGNVKSSGLWCGTKDVLLGFSTKDTIPVCPGNILTLFLATSSIEICCMNTPMMYALTQYHMGIQNHKLVF